MNNPFKIFAAIFVLAVLSILYYMAPNIVASNVPGFLNKNIGSFLIVDQSDFNRSPPELVLTGIHLKNPGEFGQGDAVFIGRANIVFSDYSRDPYNIKSITLQNIQGKQVIRSENDNLTAVHSLLMDRKYQTPHGQMAKPVNLGNVITNNVAVTSEDGKIVKVLQNKNLTPAGAMAEQPPLQNVIVDVLGMIVEQQQAGTEDIAIKGMADKATETIKEIGTSLKSFLQGP